MTDYYMPLPMDFVLLGKMPEIGMIGGIHWKGRQVKDLRQELIDGGVDAAMVPQSQIAARLRSMHVAGYVKNFASAGAGGATIWARTPEGTTFLATRDEVLGAQTGEPS